MTSGMKMTDQINKKVSIDRSIKMSHTQKTALYQNDCLYQIN